MNACTVTIPLHITY